MHKYLGLAALLRRHLSGENLAPFCQTLIQRATDDPNDACALMDASIVFQFNGDPDTALALQHEALVTQRHYCLPAVKQPAKLRVMALMSAGNLQANVPIECLLENSDIELHIAYASLLDNDLSKFPDHDVLFIAMSETDDNRPIINEWLPVLAEWPLPIINNPFHIERVARDTASRLLESLPGVTMPPTLRANRADLLAFAQDGANAENFPLIIRPVDSHAGRDMTKVDDADALIAAVQSMPDDEFFVSSFVDYRSTDGQYRKYRVILIDGKPFACHMAISDDWMIHYLNAGMADSAEKRAEEAQFMENFDHDFAVRHGEALAAIDRAIGLDYLGIDCAETQDGSLLVFEVDHAMVVHDMDPADIYPYKSATIQKLIAAFRDMLITASSRTNLFSR